MFEMEKQTLEMPQLETTSHESIYVFMRKQGDFLCYRPARNYTPAWDERISFAMQGKTICQLQRKLRSLLNQIDNARFERPKLEEAKIYLATLTIEPALRASSPITPPHIRKDFVRGIYEEGKMTLAFNSFVDAMGQTTTRPSKAAGYATAQNAGKMAFRRVIQLISKEC